MAPHEDMHIVRSFDAELDRLSQTIGRMGGLAESQLASALQALTQRDLELASQVVVGDEVVDSVENNINEQVVRLLALRQPMGEDLRVIMSSLKIASALERVADHAASTAHRVEILNKSAAVPAVKTVGRLGALVLSLLKESLDAYLHRDSDRALKVWQRDQEVDDLYSSLFRELLTYMMEDPRHITPCTHLMFIAKNLERVGDHATNLAEVTWFVVKGSQLKSGRPKSDDTYAIGTGSPDTDA
ncbi:phosphate signaling complex protein PhoU [Novispirillum itersonii]|uniref:phosphate signaling complex protein PhoU n=1 Tax=Novispirillum itersonii TaxID=189 RepID=UPI00036C22D8|nr:phosphate signaling complex protein PhoU [Novispirillum itersonii]